MERIHNRKASVVCTIICLIAFLSYSVFLMVRLYKVAVVDYVIHAKDAASSQWKLMNYEADRGLIYDANGITLASNTYNYTIVCTPREIHADKLNRDQIINNFAILLDMTVEDLDKILPPTVLDEDGKEVYDTTDPRYAVDGMDLKRNITSEQKDQFEKFVLDNGISGVSYVAIPQRYYNYGRFASQIIGYARNTGDGLNGLYGLEAYYNSLLSGTDGYRYSEVDLSTGGALPYSQPVTTSVSNGYNLVLNVDMNIQMIAEEECRAAYETYSPRGGVTCIVMNPNTGAVYAMVSLPDYDLNDPYGVPYGMNKTLWKTYDEDTQVQYLMSSVWRNRCISDTYEPGSTFKSLTTAMAFEENLSNENEEFSDAPIQVSELDTISCWMQKSYHYNHGIESLTNGFEQSCNPIFVQLAYRIGISKYYQYVHALGFYETTGIDLPAEGVGIFHSNPSLIDMACLSFGESATVTPIQLINSYCALINGGSLMTPHIVKYITDQDGNIIDEIEPEVIRTVFSEETCSRVRSLMEKVVEEGTGSAGKVIGYSVAGKTSTATIENGEEAGMHVLSFSCYAPSYSPEIAVLVVLNRPEDRSVGSSAPASVAARIVERTLTYMNVPRVFTEADYEKLVDYRYVLNVIGFNASKASSNLAANGVTTIYGAENMDSETIVGFTYPTSTDYLYTSGSAIVVLYPEGTTQDDMIITSVPSLTGKNAVECFNSLSNCNLNIRYEGDISGVCIAQSYNYLETIPAGSIVTVVMGDAKDITPVPEDISEEGGELNSEELTGEELDIGETLSESELEE
ncbi:MAG: penicillin-binding protein 2 [Clostridia bacterium]|nr:penicillin-binding protein 2 [Clostridia bacterium]